MAKRDSGYGGRDAEDDGGYGEEGNIKITEEENDEGFELLCARSGQLIGCHREGASNKWKRTGDGGGGTCFMLPIAPANFQFHQTEVHRAGEGTHINRGPQLTPKGTTGKKD
eukprot:CAMPEP_0118682636 /NCGR_PEP_ID=MMETSP0800-20121206/5589_1 /TAXON_ID=210618 ORGANISM="Striatella unipunctata, Strain CCMP2910" /NCGR_SAMPLE_ID=MMETSP0800 /ASSEMBLY_ACC=CAM_ASM_000638 /LENGTH=111 /DNA_ID=CAMNT_0006579035 /DNA_START=227 /DNA_END=561 /DNA_ORIENTATION=+